VVEAGEEGDSPDAAYVDNGELEEAMNGLEARRRISAKFKWRRSK